MYTFENITILKNMKCCFEGKLKLVSLKEIKYPVCNFDVNFCISEKITMHEFNIYIRYFKENMQNTCLD